MYIDLACEHSLLFGFPMGVVCERRVEIRGPACSLTLTLPHYTAIHASPPKKVAIAEAGEKDWNKSKYRE